MHTCLLQVLCLRLNRVNRSVAQGADQPRPCKQLRLVNNLSNKSLRFECCSSVRGCCEKDGQDTGHHYYLPVTIVGSRVPSSLKWTVAIGKGQLHAEHPNNVHRDET